MLILCGGLPGASEIPRRMLQRRILAADAFLDFYAGGWQDCFPTGGDPTEYQGLPFGAHGETPTLPWDYQIVEDGPERIAVKFRVRTVRTPFYLEKVFTLERNSGVLQVKEIVLNEGRTTMQFMWGQHPALGAPFLDSSCVIALAGARVHCKQLASNSRFVPGVYEWPLVPGINGQMIDLAHVGSVADDTTDTLFLDRAQGGLVCRDQYAARGNVWAGVGTRGLSGIMVLASLWRGLRSSVVWSYL